MSLLARHFPRVTTISILLALAALGCLSRLTLADEPSHFEIKVVPQAEYAVAGQTFTYAIVITNVSQESLKIVMVNVNVPEGTVLDSTHYTNPNWFVGNPYPGRTIEQVTWITPEAVAPGEVVSFEMTVKILPEMAGQQLVSEGYTVIVSNSDLVASGPPIRTPVFTTAPTATVIPPPTATATSIPSPTAKPSAATASSTDSISAGTATPISLEEVQATATSKASSSMATLVFIAIGLSVFAALSAGLIWFLRRC